MGQRLLLSPWRMVPNATCIKMLAGSLAPSHCFPPQALDEMAHVCCATARPSAQQCVYSHDVCALFSVDPVKERDQDVLPNFPDEAVLAIQLIAHITVNSVQNVL